MQLLKLLSLPFALWVLLGVHVVREGFVGIYHRGGALLPVSTKPGFHWTPAGVAWFSEVQVSVQTDNVLNS